MIKPIVNTIKADIKNASIYLRSTKKFGKTTLFRDVILEKYGDPTRGLLVACGNEIGYKMLDNINVVHVSTWKELLELKAWLIKERGNEHNIEIVAFDTVDELALIADIETIRQSNIENPKKQVKSIKAAFGGYTAGEKYSANDLIKPYISSLQSAGFGVWAIAHTKFKTIKEKGGLDEDGYQQLTSNLSTDYESAFGDIFDVTLTGVIDRNIEEIEDGDKKKRRATDTIRKLYFRETPVIDAGGRFAFGAVPEYMVFDKPNMGKEFIQVIEEGMEKSKLSNRDGKKNISKPEPIVQQQKKQEEAEIETEIETENNQEPFPMNEPVEEEDKEDAAIIDDPGLNDDPYSGLSDKELIAEATKKFKATEDESIKDGVRAIIKPFGRMSNVDRTHLIEILNLF